MTINQDLLTDIARKATESSSKSLSLLVGKEVTVETTRALYLPLGKLINTVTGKQDTEVVAFSQLISGIKGAALLVMSHNDALHLVDALMKRPDGTTKVLTKIDTSAIKETLNILSNSQLTTLAKNLGITVNVMPPSMISLQHIAQVVEHLSSHQAENTEIIAFETSLKVIEQQSQVTMFIVFDADLAAIISKKEGET